MKTKLIGAVVSSVLLLSLVGCGNSGSQPATGDQSTTTTTQPAAATQPATTTTTTSSSNNS